MGKFCEVGVQLNMEMFDPYYLSPDGSSEGLGSFKHEQFVKNKTKILSQSFFI